MNDLVGHLDYLRDARASADDVTISLPKDLADRVEVVAGDMQCALANAADVFEGLEYVMNNDSASGNGRFVTAVMRLTNRALNDIAEKEGGEIERVASLIRHAQDARIKSTLAKAAGPFPNREQPSCTWPKTSLPLMIPIAPSWSN